MKSISVPRQANRHGKSILYCLAPKGVGTGFVESLTSYVRRLAEAHVARPSTLFNKFVGDAYRAAGGALGQAASFSEALNADVPATAITIAYLQALTWIPEIDHTALGGRVPGIYWQRCVRVSRAWCPECLASDGEPYDRMVWIFKDYRACVVHDRELVDVCSNCDTSHEPLRAKVASNRCANCLAALSATPSTPRAAGERERALVDLIARLECGKPVTTAQVQAGARAFTQRYGGVKGAGVQAGLTHSGVAQVAKNGRIAIRTLLTLLVRGDETLDEFLDHAPSALVVKLRPTAHQRGGRKARSVAHLEPVLEQLLAGDAPLPSVYGFARAHGVEGDSLREQLPMITDAFIARGTAERRARSAASTRALEETVEVAVRAAHAETGKINAAVVGPRLPKAGILRSPIAQRVMDELKRELLSKNHEEVAA